MNMNNAHVAVFAFTFYCSARKTNRFNARNQHSGEEAPMHVWHVNYELMKYYCHTWVIAARPLPQLITYGRFVTALRVSFSPGLYPPVSGIDLQAVKWRSLTYFPKRECAERRVGGAKWRVTHSALTQQTEVHVLFETERQQSFPSLNEVTQ